MTAISEERWCHLLPWALQESLGFHVAWYRGELMFQFQLHTKFLKMCWFFLGADFLQDDVNKCRWSNRFTVTCGKKNTTTVVKGDIWCFMIREQLQTTKNQNEKRSHIWNERRKRLRLIQVAQIQTSRHVQRIPVQSYCTITLWGAGSFRPSCHIFTHRWLKCHCNIKSCTPMETEQP